VTERAPAELERVSRQYRPALLAYFRRRVSSHAEAEDMTQEVFIRLARKGEDNLEVSEPFIFRIAANILRDHARRQRVRHAYRSRVLQDTSLGIDPLDPHRSLVARETLGALWSGIQALPEPTRQIFVLYRVEGIDKQTIADSFALHVRTVEKHITRAMVALARRIEKRP
jgi:RNA polymerase sigma factor (sigma-70 family)